MDVTITDDPVTIEDLRPSLGDLNWELRRAGLSLSITTSDTGVVLSATVIEGTYWTVHCDPCGMYFAAGTSRHPACPRCGHKV